MKMKKIALTACMLIFGLQLTAQNPVPAPKQQKGVCIVGAIAHLGNGDVIENSFVAFENGTITQVGNFSTDSDVKDFEVIEAKGKHVYPGFIATNSDLGLVEIGAVRSTRDSREVGIFNPNIRSIIAYNTDSEVIPTLRNHGILSAQVCPQGGTVSGSSSVVHLDGWNWEDAALLTDGGIHLNWPSRFSYNRRLQKVSKNEKYGEQLSMIENTLKEAKAYSTKTDNSPKNLKFEAMRGLFEGTQKLYVHADDAPAMTQAVLLAKKHEMSCVIVGGRQAWRIAGFLKENNVSIILNKPQSLPQRADDDIDQPFKNAVLLEKAGVQYCISMGGNWTQRNLGFQAGQSIGFGLEYEQAVRAITLGAARILGIDKQMGSIEKGKDATLFISSGDALDMRTGIVERAFIQGRDIDLGDKQKYLYKKFSTKYKRGE